MKQSITTISIHNDIQEVLEHHKSKATVTDKEMTWSEYMLYLLSNCSIMDLETLTKIQEVEKKMKLVKDNNEETKMEEKICVLCKKKYTEWGNNAQPIAEGQCCDNCNTTKVIPARIENMRKQK